jgi:PAS domain S-box-containing protein
MRLADFLRSNREPILDEWNKFAQHLLPFAILNAESLRDHARGMLDAIATDLTSVQSELQQQKKSQGMGPHALQTTEAELHGSSRFAEGFDVNQMMSEFRALRACVLRLWGAYVKIPSAGADDINRFNEAIDQAMAESLAYFTEMKNRQTRLLEALLSSSPDLNYIIEPNGKLLYANRAFAGFFGKPASEILGADFFSLCGPFVSDIGTRVRQVTATRKTFRSEMCASSSASESRTFEYLLVPVLNQEGRCEAIAGSARDITARSIRRAHSPQCEP